MWTFYYMMWNQSSICTSSAKCWVASLEYRTPNPFSHSFGTFPIMTLISGFVLISSWLHRQSSCLPGLKITPSNKPICQWHKSHPQFHWSEEGTQLLTRVIVRVDTVEGCSSSGSKFKFKLITPTINIMKLKLISLSRKNNMQYMIRTCFCTFNWGTRNFERHPWTIQATTIQIMHHSTNERSVHIASNQYEVKSLRKRYMKWKNCTRRERVWTCLWTSRIKF